MEAFLAFCGIFWGILSIILFFKIWVMTNHVKELRDYFLREEDARKKAEEEKYSFNEGENVVCNGKVYEVVEKLPHGMYKCKDVKTGYYHSLLSSVLKTYNGE